MGCLWCAYCELLLQSQASSASQALKLGIFCCQARTMMAHFLACLPLAFMVAEAKENKLDCLRIVEEPAKVFEGKWQWLRQGSTGMTSSLQSGWSSDLAYSA